MRLYRIMYLECASIVNLMLASVYPLTLHLHTAYCMLHGDRVASVWYIFTCYFSLNSVFVVVLGPRNRQSHGKVQTMQARGLK